MKITLPKQIEEFFSAVINPYSYNLRKNLYIWFGILWGMPIPIVTMIMQVYFLKASEIPHPLLVTILSPAQWLFLLHPLLFGTVFGILGTIRFDKDSELTSKINELKDLSIHDPLTGLKNRRYFIHFFHDECARSLRRKESLSLLFMDIDHFKMINDTHGHYFGDIVLQEMGDYLLHHCRPYDTPVRWGGEEFLVLLRGADEVKATQIAERFRSDIESVISPKIKIPVTISIGLSAYITNDTLEKLTDRADQALYHAKQTGRNKVVSWTALTEANHDIIGDM